QVERRVFGLTELFAQHFESRGIAVVAAYIPQQTREFVIRGGVDSSVLLKTSADARTQVVHVLRGSGDANYRNLEPAAFDHALKSGKDLLECQISRRTKQHQCIRMRLVQATFSKCPPNSNRNADSNLF